LGSLPDSIHLKRKRKLETIIAIHIFGNFNVRLLVLKETTSAAFTGQFEITGGTRRKVKKIS
jgi:hypothetical protein